MKQTIKLTEQWFGDRQIIENSTPLKQALKTSEEILELQHAILDNNREEIIDAIGDIQVTLIGVCLHCKIDFEDIYRDMLGKFKKEEPFILSAFYQAIKLEEELIEFKGFVYKDIRLSNYYTYRILFYLNRIAYIEDLTLEQCLKSAYNEISKRTGKMINGQFVKD